MSNNMLVEWGEFAPKHLVNERGKHPTRRVGKRLIRDGQIPGKIIDNKPWVDVNQFLLAPIDAANTSTYDAAVALLS